MSAGSAQPIYKLIKDDILRQIEEKIYGPNQCLPSERDLSAKYDTTRMTVRHALNDLEADGVVYRIQGKGTFVAANKVVQPLMRASGFSQDMLRRGRKPSSKVLFAGVMKADHIIAKDLHIGVGQEYVLIKRLRLADDTPMAIESTALSRELCGDILSADLDHGSIYEKLRGRGLKLVTGNQYMEAVLATDATAVFASSDNIALGLLKRLHEMGKSIPGDISVVSYDNSAADVLFEPALTAIEQDPGVLAGHAFGCMSKRLAGRGGRRAEEVVLEPALIVKGSVLDLTEYS